MKKWRADLFFLKPSIFQEKMVKEVLEIGWEEASSSGKLAILGVASTRLVDLSEHLRLNTPRFLDTA